jgi:predicted Rossmann fold flavoprotein
LSRYTQWDFLALIAKYRIPFHEREHGQLFCNDSAKDIVTMLLAECEAADVKIQLNTRIEKITAGKDLPGFKNLEGLNGKNFTITTDKGVITSESLVIATGGLSIPKIGATPLGYQIAHQFGINVLPTRAGLVPLTLHADDKTKFAPLSGIAVPCVVSNERQSFKEAVLFTHRGLSGPAILQISSYWQAGEAVLINLLPDFDLTTLLKAQRLQKNHAKLKSLLAELLPKRLTIALLPEPLLETTVTDLSDAKIAQVAAQLHEWTLKPNSTEGYRTAEVTLGGVDCAAISSKTMQSQQVSSLFFIGEVLDVSGWLGGYNFQWAWSSGWCAGQFV